MTGACAWKICSLTLCTAVDDFHPGNKKEKRKLDAYIVDSEYYFALIITEFGQ